MRVSHLVLHAFIHMTAVTMIPFVVLTALIFYMVSTVGTFVDFLLILLVNLTANGTDVAIVILICVTIPGYATPIAHVVCAYVTFFEGFLYPVPDIHTAIRVSDLVSFCHLSCSVCPGPACMVLYLQGEKFTIGT